VRDEKKAVLPKAEEEGVDHDEGDDGQGDMGGVVLRREQVKLVMLGKRDAEAEGITGMFYKHPQDLLLTATGTSSEFEVGSLSRITHKRLTGYEPLPEWTDEPTDSSLRDSEVSPLAAPTLLALN
jgi:AP-3 complex subunit beta